MIEDDIVNTHVGMRNTEAVKCNSALRMSRYH